MALMIRYCKAHRCAWPVVDGENECPFPDHDQCDVVAAEAIGTINELGREVEEGEYTENWGMVPEPPDNSWRPK